MPAAKFPLYLFLAEEDFLKEEALEKLKAKFLDRKTKDLNYSVFYARDKNFSAREMIDSLGTMPFLSKKRMVVLKDADSMTASDKKAVISYLMNPKDTSVFVIESPSPAIKGEFLLEASTRANLYYFRRLTDSGLDGWLVKKAASYGKEISRDAVRAIKESLPNDLRTLSSNIENIILYVGNRGLITKKDVEDIVGINPSHTAFDLMDRIEKRDARRALHVFSSLRKGRKKETELLGLMAWNVRMLLRIKELLGIGQRTEMRRDLGLSPAMFDQFVRLAQGFKKGQILTLLDEILRSDLEIKSGASPKIVMERLIVEMCS